MNTKLLLWADNPGLGILRGLTRAEQGFWQGHTPFESGLHRYLIFRISKGGIVGALGTPHCLSLSTDPKGKLRLLKRFVLY